jgi:hypothetical protein
VEPLDVSLKGAAILLYVERGRCQSAERYIETSRSARSVRGSL